MIFTIALSNCFLQLPLERTVEGPFKLPFQWPSRLSLKLPLNRTQDTSKMTQEFFLAPNQAQETSNLVFKLRFWLPLLLT